MPRETSSGVEMRAETHSPWIQSVIRAFSCTITVATSVRVSRFDAAPPTPTGCSSTSMPRHRADEAGRAFGSIPVKGWRQLMEFTRTSDSHHGRRAACSRRGFNEPGCRSRFSWRASTWKRAQPLRWPAEVTAKARSSATCSRTQQARSEGPSHDGSRSRAAIYGISVFTSPTLDPEGHRFDRSIA
jgi:hypothetical protein